MKSKIRSIVVHSSALAVAIFVLAGCQKSIVPEGLPIRFAISAENGTKGGLINTDGSDKALADKGVTSFKASAYNGTSPVFTTPGLDPANVETVSYSGDVWTMANTYYWPQATNLNFYACANMPASTVATADFNALGLTLNYTAVPEDATAQKDILLGHYQGNGGNTGTARIHFEHPLTAVRFLRGDIDESLVIKSISIKGVAASGTATMDASGAINWSEVSAYTHTVSQTKDSGLSVDGSTKLIGEPFIIIPQNLSVNGVTVSVVFTDGTVLETTISAGTWQSGKTNAYTLKYVTGKFTLSVTAWNEQAEIPLALEEEDPNLLLGKFSVSANKYVQFSRGNLQATYHQSSGKYTWNFATNQYDIIGNAAGNTKIKNDGSNDDGAVVDLFGWSTATTNYGIDISTNNNTYSGDFKDWSTAFNISGLCTLSKIEWDYLLYQRTDAVNKWGLATVVSVTGVVILPDDWTLPGECTFKAGNNSGYNTNKYDPDAWTQMEQAGAVFLPAAGYRDGTSFDNASLGYYWSGTASSTAGNAYRMNFSNGGVAEINDQNRYRGHSVRLAQKFFKPHEYVDLDLPNGTLWATCNLGAEHPYDYGDYYAWGETAGYNEKMVGDGANSGASYSPGTVKTNYSWAYYKWGSGKHNLGKYVDKAGYGMTTPDGKTVLDLEDDAARANWGGDWRMPTAKDWKELLDNTTNKWINLNGVYGRLFTSKKDSSKTLFIPAAGRREDTGFFVVGNYGYYWSSSLNTDEQSCGLHIRFYNDDVNWPYETDRCSGLSVRPVLEVLGI